MSDLGSSIPLAPKRRLRSILCLATAVVIAFGTTGVYRWFAATHAPYSYGSWANLLFESGNRSSAVPQYFMGCFTAYGQPPTIAYMVRIDDRSKLLNPVPWLRSSKGQVFVENQFVPRRSGILQLFIDNGRMSPLRVDVPIKQIHQYFNPDAVYFNKFAQAKSFWENILRADRLLSSTSSREIALEHLTAESPQ